MSEKTIKCASCNIEIKNPKTDGICIHKVEENKDVWFCKKHGEALKNFLKEYGYL